MFLKALSALGTNLGILNSTCTRRYPQDPLFKSMLPYVLLLVEQIDAYRTHSHDIIGSARVKTLTSIAVRHYNDTFTPLSVNSNLRKILCMSCLGPI